MQNLERTQTDLQEQIKQSHSKMGKGYEQALFQRRHLCGQETYEKNPHHHWSLEKCKSKPH